MITGVAVPDLLPGPEHPFPPMTPGQFARRMRIQVRQVLSWIEAGMPAATDGGLDAFGAINWLSNGPLESCPVLARRWRNYLDWFRPFVSGLDRARTRHCRRVHRLHLPHAVDQVTWHLPSLLPTPGQEGIVTEQAMHLIRPGPPRPVPGGPVHPRLEVQDPGAGAIVVSEQSRMVLRPRQELSAQDPDHRVLLALVEELAGDFRYEYRHHVRSQGFDEDRLVGSCLDCVLTLDHRLRERGRPTRLCLGVVAHTALANPHCWLETESTCGWVVLDPTLPAIARMLGADWRAFARAYTGGCDGRRIEFGRGVPAISGIAGGATMGSLVGEAEATVSGGTANAWACLDWVCGECDVSCW